MQSQSTWTSSSSLSFKNQANCKKKKNSWNSDSCFYDFQTGADPLWENPLWCACKTPQDTAVCPDLCCQHTYSCSYDHVNSILKKKLHSILFLIHCKFGHLQPPETVCPLTSLPHLDTQHSSQNQPCSCLHFIYIYFVFLFYCWCLMLFYFGKSL